MEEGDNVRKKGGRREKRERMKGKKREGRKRKRMEGDNGRGKRMRGEGLNLKNHRASPKKLNFD